MVALAHKLPGLGLEDAEVRTFRNRIRGSVTSPGDAAYEEARLVWNAPVAGE